MPRVVEKDSKGKPVDLDKMIAYLEAKWGPDRKCPMCAGGPWSISDTICEVRQSKMPPLGKYTYYPVVPITCVNCGNTILINALVAEQDTAEEEAVASAGETGTESKDAEKTSIGDSNG